ncbi:MAG: hypothetical protein RIS17_1770, partial [Pseudomonadota bacterium]
MLDFLNQVVDFTTLPVRPDALTIGSFVLRWYSLAYIIGIAAAWFLLTRMIRLPGTPLDQKR